MKKVVLILGDLCCETMYLFFNVIKVFTKGFLGKI